MTGARSRPETDGYASIFNGGIRLKSQYLFDPIRGKGFRFFIAGVCTAVLLSGCSADSIRRPGTSDTSKTDSIQTDTVRTEIPPTTVFPSVIREPILSSENRVGADLIREYLCSVRYNGVVLVAHRGEVIFEGAYGFSDLKEGTWNRTETIFELGSITKQFTATAVLMLAEQGKLSLEDPMSLYLPEYPKGEGITVRNLLNMTSGIPDYVTCGALGMSYDDLETASVEDVGRVRAIIEKEYTHEEIMRLISPYDLLFEAGTNYHYSNTNYYFLGMIIEKLSGMSYFDFLEKYIFEPVGMEHTSTDPSDLTSCGSVMIPFGRVYLPSQDRSLSYAAGVICSNASDLYKWEQAVLAGDLLSVDSRRQMFDPGDFGYGLGWSIGLDYYEHGGQTVGYNSHVLVVPSSRTVIILLSNIQGTGDYFSGANVNSEQVATEIYGILSDQQS